jgi:hypothetical protein
VPLWPAPPPVAALDFLPPDQCLRIAFRILRCGGDRALAEAAL